MSVKTGNTEQSNQEPDRRALVLAINYREIQEKKSKTYKPPPELSGPQADAVRICKFLKDTLSYSEKDITLMVDDPSVMPHLVPSRENILKRIENFIQDATPETKLFLYFAGHGRRVKDDSKDEPSGYDSAIVCMDGEIITDDELYDLLVKLLPEGCCLTGLFDCCHSGTIMDLPCQFSHSGKEKSPFRHLFSSDAQSVSRVIRAATHKNKPKADVVVFSGCKDSQTAKEWRCKYRSPKHTESVYCAGHMTDCFLKVMKDITESDETKQDTRNLNCVGVHMKICEEFQKEQNPQIIQQARQPQQSEPSEPSEPFQMRQQPQLSASNNKCVHMPLLKRL